MKKVLFTLATCLVGIQSLFAELPPFGESVAQYSTIINFFATTVTPIPASERIVDISYEGYAHHHCGTATNQIVYEVTTRGGGDDFEFAALADCHHHRHSHRYEVILTVIPNPAIGPSTYVVAGISTR